jgi:hypothetical protein
VTDRRALTLGAGVIVTLVVGFRGFPAWRAWRADARAAAAERITQAAQTDAVLAGFESSLDTLERRTARMLAVAPALLTGDTPAEAVSNLAALVADAARAASVRLDAVDIRVDSSKVHVLPRVSIELQATADVVGLAALLRRLEGGPTLLAVRRLSVRPQNPASPPEVPEMLSVRLTVEGLALIRQGGKAS